MKDVQRSRFGAVAICAAAIPTITWLMLFAGDGPNAQQPLAAPAPSGAPAGTVPANLALIVAIDEYQQPDDEDRQLPKLQGAANDATRVAQLLQDRFHFAAADIVSLVGPAATHEAIVRTFHDHLIRRAGPETRVIVWFSGHGSLVPDAAKADPAESDHDSPLDNTFLAYDSRAGKRHGSYDVTDDELHSLFAALRAEDVVWVTDCCHSGGLMRGAAAKGVRHANAGTQPLDREAIKAFWPRELPFLDDDRGSRTKSVVQIAACRSTQEAGECRGVGENRMYGTLTWFLTSALAEVDPGTSWRTVTETVRARVAACREGTRPGQIVECIGDAERAIFGGRGKSVPVGYQVHRYGNHLEIEAGRIHGIVEDSELRIVGLDDKEHGLARVFRARTTICEAEPIGGARPPDGVALRAVPHKGLQGRPKLRVRCAKGVDEALLKDCPWAVLADGGEADYVLATRGEGLVLQTPDGTFVRGISRSPARAHRALFHEHCFRSLWEGVAQSGRHRIGMEFRPPSPDETATKRPVARFVPTGEGRLLVGAPHLPEKEGGALLVLRVTNESSEPLHVAVLSVAEDRAVNILVLGKTSNNVLQPGGHSDIEVELGPSTAWGQDRPMVDRYIAIATPRFADFRPFVCDPQEEDSRDADPTRGGNGLRGDNLPVFLEGALTGATTRGGGEKAAAAPAWGIHWIDLELVLPARFDELTRTKTSKPESMSKGALKR